MDADYGQHYRELYRRHWWWRAREKILVRTLSALDLPPACRILDVGCGDALTFPVLERFGSVEGIETDQRLLDPDNPRRSRVHTDPLGHPRYSGWQFDLVTALDVLEHLEDDHAALRQLLRLLKPGGRLLLTVPASMALWDQHDEINQHFRRYSSAMLRQLLPADVEVMQLRYLFQSLYPLKWTVARINRLRPQNQLAQHKIPGSWASAAMTAWCSLEDRLLAPFRLPFGSSLLALVQLRMPASDLPSHPR